MLETTKLLQSEGIAALEPLAIKVKEYDDFYILNYSQTDSPKAHPVVMECRGLIVDKINYQPLAQSFRRFFNYGEADTVEEVAKRKFNDAVVWEKVDGSLITVWFNPYTHAWQCSTRSMGFAEGNVGDQNITFKELFEKALGKTVEEKFKGISSDTVFVFELVSPESRVTKQYNKVAVYLINVREKGREGTFLDLHNWCFGLDVGRPYHTHLDSVEKCVDYAAQLPEQDEGYVVQWPDGYRVKIKNPAHVALAHLRNNGALSDKRILSLITQGEAPEYLVHFPEDEKRFYEVESSLKALRLAVSNEWLDAVPELVNIEDEKDMAKHISTLKYKNFHFAKWRHNKNFDEYFGELTENKKIAWLT